MKLVSILKLSLQKHIFPFSFVFILNVGRYFYGINGRSFLHHVYGSNLVLSTVEDLKSLSPSRIIFNKTTLLLEAGFSLKAEITDHEAKNYCVMAKADWSEPFFAQKF